MAAVTMPDGAVVEMPDTLTPELGARLRAFQASSLEPKSAPTANPSIMESTGLWTGSKPLDFGDMLSKAANAAGGKVTDMFANAGAPAPVAAGLGTAVNVGIESVPALFGGAIGKTAAPMFNAAGKRLMQSAVKPTLADMKSGKGDVAIKTLLDEGINPTRGGMDVLKGKIDGLTGQIDAVVLANGGKTIDKAAVAQRLQKVIDDIERTNPTPNAARRAVEDTYNEFIKNGIIPKNIPVQQAQELKKGIYRELGDRKYSGAPYSAADVIDTRSKKAIAGGLREDLAKAIPEIDALNAEQSKLIKTLNVAERRALMEANSNPAGLAWLTHHPSTFAAYLADKSTLFKSLLARELYKGSSGIPSKLGALGGTLYGAQGVLSQQREQPQGVLSSMLTENQ